MGEKGADGKRELVKFDRQSPPEPGCGGGDDLVRVPQLTPSDQH